MDLTITPFNPITAPGGDLAEHYEIARAVRREKFPELPDVTREFHKASVCASTTVWGSRLHWVARHGGRIVGSATLDLPERENRGMAFGHVRVPPELRRDGIGTALLRAVLPACRAEGRDTIVAPELSAGGAGEAWTLSLGFVRVEGRIRQTLRIADVDPSTWRVPSPAGFRAMRWTGAAPQEVVAGFARARTALEDAPTGESSFEQPAWTVERVRANEAAFRGRGSEVHTVVAIHEASGTVAGLTEIEIAANVPDIALQQATAVLPEFRGHGLGRFLKAAMMRRLTAEHPRITHVLTGTGVDNEHMTRVNLQLGYTTVQTLVNLETSRNSLEERLGWPRSR
jgi:mycothiol synthase